MTTTPATTTTSTFDTTRRFVRVTRERANGLVEFDFAVGEPELFVEMILSREAFDSFCQRQQAEVLPPQAPATGAPEAWDWRMGDATGQRPR